jgi:nitrite reductase/ring-hydroxylating ferredoxin subunit
LVALALVALGAVVAALVTFAASRGDGRIALGTAADYAPGSVVYRSTDHFFVVRALDGRVLALSDLDPHNPPGRESCRVTFRPDLGRDESGGGRFFDACTGATYNREGRAQNGDGLDLRPIAVQQEKDGRLYVRP